MKSLALPVAVTAVALLLAETAEAQSGIRYLAMAGGKTATGPVTSRKPSARLTSQIIGESATDGAYSAGEMTSGGYVASGGGNAMPYVGASPVDPGPPGPGYGPWGVAYGYNPDFGIVGNGMSVWPGVPACCDPWLGYCGEPRCNHCSCGRGRYLYVRCNHDTCTPEIVTWGKRKCEGCGGGGCASCGTCAACSANGYSASYSPTPSSVQTTIKQSPSPAANAAPNDSKITKQPAAKRTPPRNNLPKIPPAPSALGKSETSRG
jgi:hypothetical protein